MVRLGAALAALVLLTTGCAEDEAPEPNQADPPARRRSPITGPALASQSERLQRRACACESTECAEAAIEAIEDFGRRYLAVAVEAEHEARIKTEVDAALTCLRPLLQATDP